MKTRTWIAMTMLAASLAGVAACSGDDDDDDASPTPYFVDICYVIWARPAAVADRYDAYIWQGAASQASNGASSYVFNVDELDSILGFFYYRTDRDFDTYVKSGVATNGEFSLTVAGLLEGDAWDFEDTDSNRYFEFVSDQAPLGVQIASNGTGTFDGVLSDPAVDVDPTPGTGTLTIAFAGSSIAMNAQLGQAVCIDLPSTFAPSRYHPSPVVLEAARRALAKLP